MKRGLTSSTPTDAVASPRRRSGLAAPTHQSGFTLIESVIVIAITGVLAAIVSMFIVSPVQAYLSTAARATLVDHADLSLRRIGRDLRIALPNSVRVNGTGRALELVPTTSGARYSTEGAGALDFGVVDAAFNIVGPALTLASASQSLVFYNLGPGVIGSDAYAANSTALEQATSNRRTSTTAAGSATSIGISSAAGLPAMAFSAPYRVLAVDTPVTYRCDLTAGTLTRFQGYGWQATQPDPPSGGTSAVMATGVTACNFSANSSLVAARAALVNLRLTLAATAGTGTESVTLQHAVYVDNLP